MRFCLKKMKKLGLHVEVDQQDQTLLIDGDAPFPEELVTAFDEMSRDVCSHMSHIGGFEAQRLVDKFADELAATNMMNAIKDCTVSR